MITPISIFLFRMKWHTLSIEEIFSHLKTSSHGLNHEEVKIRTRQYGYNRLKTRKGPNLFVLFFRQLLNPLVFILVLGAMLQFVISDVLDGSVLAGTILIMVLISFFQEIRAEKAVQSLKQLYSHKSKVKRNNKTEVLHSEYLVPGDVVVLEAGDRIPADGRIIECTRFRVNESSLTGESSTIEKHYGPISEEHPLAERNNMVYTGTTVATGKATMVCVATGMNSELGKIATAIQEIKPEKTPLQKSIHSLGIWMSSCIFVIIALFSIISFYKGYDWLEIVLFAISAAIAAIPEGLPVAVTVVLSTGMHVMAKKNAIIRRLSAVETLGSTTVIASDKTGTLTQNQMTVQKTYVFHRSEIREKLMFEIGVLANDAFINKEKQGYEIVGDPTEAALLIAAEKAGINHTALAQSMPRLEEIPFESETRYMATLNQTPVGKRAFVKGAPEKLLQLSHLQDHEKKEVKEEIARYSQEGLRLLAVGYVDIPPDNKLREEALQGKLDFIGIFAMLDPPREEATKAVQSCHEAGIRVVMITGDNKHTAEVIAKQLGIDASEGSLSSREIETLSEVELKEKVQKINVFARIEPLHKLKIVRAFKEQGHVVAMTGDGVNDAPALEAADIGIAMGITGTDVAKEASDMILSDDNFSSIETAVEEGRAIFNRLRFVVTFLLTTGVGELLGLILSIIFTEHVYLVPLQILWINLISGVTIAVPLAIEPKSGEELKQPPRSPQVKLLHLGMIYRILFLSCTLGISSFGIYYYALSSLGLTIARTMVFCAVVTFEWLIAFNVRSDEKTAFQIGLFSNKALLVPIVIGIILQLLILYVPFLQAAFQTHPLTPAQWSLVLIPGLLVFFLETFRKLLFPKLFNRGKWA